jgi:hypothetical protein
VTAWSRYRMGKDVAPRLVAQLEARTGKTITRSGGG